jgi:hemerythrin superfamily protein
MIKEIIGIAEGILHDLHADHAAVALLIDDIADSNDASERNRLFQEMRSKLLTHSHAEEQVLYRRLAASQREASRDFAQKGKSEHQLVEQQLQKMSATDDKMSETWTEQLTQLQKLIDDHVDVEESTGFNCARDEFDRQELESMGTQFQLRKDELMVGGA